MNPCVLRTFGRYQQIAPKSVEAGGQLFAQISGDDILLQVATEPRPTDTRTRYSYRPNRSAEQAEIDQMYRQGLYFVGDWHTHPEAHPQPSWQDLRSIRDVFLCSKHHLNAFILVIVGTAPLPDGLYFALHNSTESMQLYECSGIVHTK